MNEDEKVNIHAALAMITSGQLLFLGSIFTPRPKAAAALASVVNVRLVSVSSNKRFSAARLVCMRLAMAVLVSCWAFMADAVATS